MSSFAGSSAPVASGDAKSKVLAAVDVVELIGKTVSLKRRGSKFLGLCPFHSEKTPSFNVDSARQYFYCFGCKASGNAIDFVMKRDRLEFLDAMKQLANEYNVELPRFGAKQNVSERQMLLEANSAAGALFEKFLSHPQQGAAAREYLDSRGFTRESIQRFHLGVAVDSWDALLRSDEMRKFAPPQLALAGLAKSRENGNGFYDTFRNRLMFPIRDENGRVIAFGGRVMPRSSDPAKYLNSPETPLFSKSRSIFGIDLARQRIVETRTAAVVEGYTDVMMAHQYGATNVVATLGTAMTEQHVGILRRFADKIVLLFDADTAGQNAIDRAVQLFLTQPVEIAIASIPEDLDPDEYLLKHGVEGFNALLDNAQDALTYKWKQLANGFDESDLTSQQKAVREYLDLLAGARDSGDGTRGPVDPIRWGQSLQRVSRLTGMPVDELHRMFASDSRQSRQQHRAVRRSVASDVQHDENAAAPTMATANRRLPLGSVSAQRWILGALLAEPHRWHETQKHVQPADFSDEYLHSMSEAFWSHQKDEGEPTLSEFLSLFDDEGMKSLAISVVEEVESLVDVEGVLKDGIAFLEQERRKNVERKFAEAGDLKRLVEMMKQNKSGDLRRLGPLR